VTAYYTHQPELATTKQRVYAQHFRPSRKRFDGSFSLKWHVLAICQAILRLPCDTSDQRPIILGGISTLLSGSQHLLKLAGSAGR
jgi:hypothetical protein